MEVTYRRRLANDLERLSIIEAIGGLSTEEWNDFRRFIIEQLRASLDAHSATRRSA